MAGQHFLQLTGGKPVAGHVDHIVDATHDIDVAVRVPMAAIPGEVEAGVAGPIGIDIALMVAPNGGEGARRQRLLEDDGALFAGAKLAAVLVQDAQVVTRGRQGWGAGTGLHQLHPGEVGADGPAGLRLPPMVDDGNAQVLPQPMVGGRVQPLPGNELMAQGGKVVVQLKHTGRVLLLDGAEGGGRGEEAVDPVVLNHPPEGPGVRRAHRLALKQHRGAAAQQRAIDDVGVAHHPAHVRRRPEHVPGINAVNGLHGPVQGHRMAAGVPHHAFRLAGGAGGVEDVEGIQGVHDRPVRRRGAGLPLCPIQVPPGSQMRLALRPLQHHATAHRMLGQANCLIQQGLVGNDGGHLDAAGGAQDHLGRSVVNAAGELRRGEAAEHHGVNGADAGAGQHGDDRLRHHRHVDDHPVAFAHPQRPEAAGHQRCPLAQLRVAVPGNGSGHGGVVNQRGLIAPASLHMAVQGQPASIGLAAAKPAPSAVAVSVQDAGRKLQPRNLLRPLPPKPFGVRQGTPVEGGVGQGLRPLSAANCRTASSVCISQTA